MAQNSKQSRCTVVD